MSISKALLTILSALLKISSGQQQSMNKIYLSESWLESTKMLPTGNEEIVLFSNKKVLHPSKPLFYMAPGEGFPHSCGTGWLIPNAFGTLPTEQIFNIYLTLFCLDFFLPLHSFRTCSKTFRINTYPWAFAAFCVLTAVVISIVVL